MAKKRQTTLSEKERRSSSSNLVILQVDNDNNNILMQINGCHVTAFFQAESNYEVYNRIKGILINQFSIGKKMS